MIDFGLVILIWMTQMIVYPGFRYYRDEDLLIWHRRYTQQISYIVIPLMFAQVGLVGYALIYDFSWFKVMAGVMVLIIWTSTFTQAVPLHNKIAQGHDLSANVSTLIKVNWLRTFLWTCVFLLGML
jgi:hypothetical protein